MVLTPFKEWLIIAACGALAFSLPLDLQTSFHERNQVEKVPNRDSDYVAGYGLLWPVWITGEPETGSFDGLGPQGRFFLTGVFRHFVLCLVPVIAVLTLFFRRL
jgi:hypothetical protein